MYVRVYDVYVCPQASEILNPKPKPNPLSPKTPKTPKPQNPALIDIIKDI